MASRWKTVGAVWSLTAGVFLGCESQKLSPGHSEALALADMDMQTTTTPGGIYQAGPMSLDGGTNQGGTLPGVPSSGPVTPNTGTSPPNTTPGTTGIQNNTGVNSTGMVSNPTPATPSTTYAPTPSGTGGSGTTIGTTTTTPTTPTTPSITAPTVPQPVGAAPTIPSVPGYGLDAGH